MKKRIFFRFLFVVISAADVITSAIGSEDMHLFLKPLILLSLIAYYLVSSKSLQAFFVLTLLLSLAGDVFLLYEEINPFFFLIGLGTFLIVHLILIVTYRRNQIEQVSDPLIGVRRLRMAFPILLAGIGFSVFILPKLQELRMPVIAYMTVIMAMVLTALFRYGRTTSKSFWLVFGGAMLFMLSDAILAVDKFASPVTNATTWVMLTYCAAQYLITDGVLAHERSIGVVAEA